jgi:hypothetical protein
MSTWSFLEAMMAYPEIQAKAQAEIGNYHALKFAPAPKG